MASTISAGTTSGTAIAITGDTTGNLAFQTSAGTYTQTMPNVTGTVMVSGNMPAFSAYQSSAQSIGTGSTVKVQFQTKEFDTNSNFDNATNYRFTPTVAGYYQINSLITLGNVSTTVTLYIYKNGSVYKNGLNSVAQTFNSSSVQSIVFCNGSTDYVEIYVQVSSTVSAQTGALTYFNGAMIRGL